MFCNQILIHVVQQDHVLHWRPDCKNNTRLISRVCKSPGKEDFHLFCFAFFVSKYLQILFKRRLYVTFYFCFSLAQPLQVFPEFKKWCHHILFLVAVSARCSAALSPARAKDHMASAAGSVLENRIVALLCPCTDVGTMETSAEARRSVRMATGVPK